MPAKMNTLFRTPLALLFLGAAGTVFSQATDDHEKWDGVGLSYYIDNILYRAITEKYNLEEPVVSASPVWDFVAVDFEDNSSNYFYYFQSNGMSVVRVRAVWNGGASSLPTVVDYHLKGGRVEVISQVGEKATAGELSRGLDAPLSILRRSTFTLPNRGGEKSEDHLDASSLTDLLNLFEILSKSREPIADSKSEED